MRVDSAKLRDYYSSLSDEELLAIDRDELTEAARTCYDEEVAARDLGAVEEPHDGEVELGDAAEQPGWLEGAACACTFSERSQREPAPDVTRARDALEAAGIPCQVLMEQVAEQPAERLEYRVMVPGRLALRATGVLDKEIFNAEAEARWQTHFELLSDAELRGLNPDTICAGALDLIARVRRAYSEELARRRG